MTTNDAKRAELVEELARATAWGTPYDLTDKHMQALYRQNVEERIMPIIDRLLADRAVPGPDADAVEAAARSLYFTDANPDPVKYDRVSAWKEEWEKHLAFYQSEGYDPEGFFPAFMLATKALAAVPTVQAAAGDDLDALLDSVHPRARVSWMSPQPDGSWAAAIVWWNFPTHDHVDPEMPMDQKAIVGTGPTRMEAVQNAVEAAKEAKQ